MKVNLASHVHKSGERGSVLDRKIQKIRSKGPY